MRSLGIVLVVLVLVPLTHRASPAAMSRVSRAQVPASTDNLRRIDANALNVFITNYGSLAWDLTTGDAGLLYPKGTGKTAVFAAGLWFGAQVQGQARATVAEYSMEYGPGVILPSGYADGAASPAYRTYKVARWSGNPQDSAHVEHAVDPVDPARPDPLVHHSWSEYMAGAVPYGAPWRTWRLADPAHPGDSLDVPGPDVRGDRMLWSVWNDADPARHTNEAGNSPPLDLEIRQTVHAFNRSGALGNTIFLEYQVVHPKLLVAPPGTAFADTLKNAYVSLWLDPDLGGAGDDLTACDPARSLGYCYNGTNNDAIYGSQPPALGVLLLRGPVAGGSTLGLTAFNSFVNGTDPTSTIQTYRYMQGLNADGSTVIDPTSAQPTTFVHSGDPVAYTGWRDLSSADKRMMLDAGPFAMAPGDTQTIAAAILVGNGSDRLASVTGLRTYADAVRYFYQHGVLPEDTIPPPPPPPPDICPRTSTFWAAQCPAGTASGVTAAQLDTVASRVDAMSRFFDWTGGARAGLCAVLAPPEPLDLRAQAKQQFAALLANVAAGEAGVTEADGSPIYFNRMTGFRCSLPEFSVPALLSLYYPEDPMLQSVDYVDGNPAHPVALKGVDWGSLVFGGGAGLAAGFLGSSLDYWSTPDSFATVEIRFSHTATQKGYRYLRLEQADGTAPPQGRTYVYGGFRPCNLQAWDTVRNVQLDVAFAERCVTGSDGTILPPASQPASFDSAWAPTAAADGGREYLMVARTAYSDSPKPMYQVDGAVTDDLPYLYALWSALTAADAVIDDGDRMVFTWGVRPDTTFETRLAQLEVQPLADSSVSARYQLIASCLASVNAGEVWGTVCSESTPVLVSLIEAIASRDEIRLEWYAEGAGATAMLERSAGGEWTALATLVADGSGYLRYTDRAIEPGRRYGYRLQVAGVGGAAGETWVQVPAELRLALGGLRPNPASRGATVAFTLPAKAPARLELIDVAGRRVLVREVGSLGAGSHVLRFDDAARVPAGLYFLRLTQGGVTVTARGVIVR